MSERPSILCRLCGERATHRFSKDLVAGYVGRYYECTSCQLLQSTHLDGRSADEIAALYRASEGADLDPGATWRQVCIVNRIVQLVRSRAIGRPLRVLDYGGGTGAVGAALSVGLGLRVWTYDPYAPKSGSATVISDWTEVETNGPYDLIILSEVLEHLIQPVVELQRLARALSENGWTYLTTGRYRPGGRDSTWAYLAPESGQHVCFYSASAMERVATTMGCEFVMQVGAEYEWLIGRKSPPRLPSMAALLLIRAAVAGGILKKIE